MLEIKKILCPIDFSEPSFKALKIANDFALKFSAKLYLIYVVYPIPMIQPYPSYIPVNMPMGFDIVSYQKELEKDARVSMKQVITKMVSKKVKLVPIVKSGNPADEILKLSNKEKIDLVVIATHGRTGWRHLVFGSVAEKVIRLSNRPVLAIHRTDK